MSRARASRIRALRLILITDGARPCHIERALSGGFGDAVGVSLRAPTVSARELLVRARALAPSCASAGAALFVNDRVDVAASVGAGVQLPERGLSVSDARSMLPAEAVVGCSKHDPAAAAEWSDADFVILAPFGEVPGKGPPLGEAGLARAVQGSSAPVFALGGIDEASARRAASVGAQGVAVLRAIRDADEPECVVAALLAHVDAG